MCAKETAALIESEMSDNSEVEMYGSNQGYYPSEHAVSMQSPVVLYTCYLFTYHAFLLNIIIDHMIGHQTPFR